jgi:hypothetical protein
MADPAKIAAGILQKLGSEGIEQLRTTGELPAIKLSDTEMSFLKGGKGSPFRPWEVLRDYLKDLFG